MNLKVN